MKKNFEELQTTILGNIGESYISEFATSFGFSPYGPLIKKSNPVDSLCIGKSMKTGKLKFISIEVKTKGRMKMYPCTGMDRKDWEVYLSFPTKIPVCVMFVDHISEKIYYQWVRNLENSVQPMPGRADCVMFDLDELVTYRDLTPEEVKILEENSNSNYK